MALARKHGCSDTCIGKRLHKAEGIVEGMLMMLGVRLEMDGMLSVNCREGEPLYFISEKIVYDCKNLHIMIRVVTLPRCLTRRCAGFFVPRIL